MARPQLYAWPLGTPGRGEFWPGMCVNPVSVWRYWLPMCQGEQGPGPRAAVYVHVRVGGSAGCLCPVCDPALEGSCPVSPEGATTKVTGRWWGRRLNGPEPSVADRSVSGRVFPRVPEGQCCFPSPLPLQAAFLLPQCLMPGHTATEYAICVGDMPPRPHPHPGQPLDPKGCGCHGLPSVPPTYLSSH